MNLKIPLMNRVKRCRKERVERKYKQQINNLNIKFWKTKQSAHSHAICTFYLVFSRPKKTRTHKSNNKNMRWITFTARPKARHTLPHTDRYTDVMELIIFFVHHRKTRKRGALSLLYISRWTCILTGIFQVLSVFSLITGTLSAIKK